MHWLTLEKKIFPWNTCKQNNSKRVTIHLVISKNESTLKCSICIEMKIISSTADFNIGREPNIKPGKAAPRRTSRFCVRAAQPPAGVSDGSSLPFSPPKGAGQHLTASCTPAEGNWFEWQEFKKQKQKFNFGKYIQSLMHFMWAGAYVCFSNWHFLWKMGYIYTSGVFNIVYKGFFFRNISVGRVWLVGHGSGKSYMESIPWDQSWSNNSLSLCRSQSTNSNTDETATR